MSLAPFYVDFSADIAMHSADVVVSATGASDAGTHWEVERSGEVIVSFPAAPQPDELTLTLTALVSKAGRRVGHAPLDILVNSNTVVSRHRIPGGGDLPQDMTFSVPGEWLRHQHNEVKLCSGDDAITRLWLYRLLVESVWDRNHARIEMLKRTNRHSTFRYHTETQGTTSSRWSASAPLTVQIASGDHALPAELTWRARNGGEAAISFPAHMRDFLGHLRTPDGQWLQFRGHMTERWESPPEPNRALRFRTATNWGQGWHDGDDLHLYLDTGSWPLERVSWRNERGLSAAISLTPDCTEFHGFRQDVNEGPVGFRGRRSTQETSGGYG